MRRIGRLGKRGILLISSYLVLSLFLVYSSAMTLRTSAQRLVSDHLRDRYQAMDLAQGAMEQFRNDLYEFFRVNVYQNRYAGDALSAMGWLDDLDPSSSATLDPAFTPSTVTGTVSVTGSGVKKVGVDDPRILIMPTGQGQAWIAGVTQQAGMLGARDVTIEALATVGGITKRVQATYRFEMGMSDIFRYSYFVNNYGWFDMGVNGWVAIMGEVRSNGDFRFSGDIDDMYVNGDIFASINAKLVDPNTGLTAQGTIFGDPNEDDLDWYFNEKFSWIRPERRKSFAGQPTIGGGAAELLPYGQGWDTRNYTPVSGDAPPQQRFDEQSTQDIPYLGNLDLYRSLAQESNNGAGTTLTFATPGDDGIYGSWDDGETTINSTYNGTDPLIVVGTDDHPIRINGPFVANGDVIIKGSVEGRGTIYAGRNVHIVGDIWYTDMPRWYSLERDSTTGKVRNQDYFDTNEADSDLGSICANGTYVPNTVPVASRCP